MYDREALLRDLQPIVRLELVHHTLVRSHPRPERSDALRQSFELAIAAEEMKALVGVGAPALVFHGEAGYQNENKQRTIDLAYLQGWQGTAVT